MLRLLLEGDLLVALHYQSTTHGGLIVERHRQNTWAAAVRMSYLHFLVSYPHAVGFCPLSLLSLTARHFWTHRPTYWCGYIYIMQCLKPTSDPMCLTCYDRCCSASSSDRCRNICISKPAENQLILLGKHQKTQLQTEKVSHQTQSSYRTGTTRVDNRSPRALFSIQINNTIFKVFLFCNQFV